MDRGPSRPNDIVRYHLNPELYLDLHKTASELQFYLQSRAGLISERTTHFIIDPKNTFLTILNGAHDLAQLHAAWMGIIKQLELGIKYINKYESEYLESDVGRRMQSPVSTDPGIIENLLQLTQPNDRMRHLYSQIPHHQSDLTEDALRRFDELRDWQDIYPLPPNLLHDDRPRIQTPTSELPRTSYKSNGQFILPAAPTQPAQAQAPSLQEKGKGREWMRPSRPSGAATSLFMGPSTPWKSSTQFLNPPGSQRNPVPGVAPPEEGVAPNVLHGLGSLNSGIWGEDGLPANGQMTVMQGLTTGQPPIGGLISAPPIPVGFRSFQWNPVESGGVEFGRKAC